MAYLIGIDVGTTGAKTILVDESGQLHASALEEYPLYTPHPKWAEQESGGLWQATMKSIQKVLAESQVSPKEIKGLGLSGQMHGLVLMDSGHRVLRPAMLWCDVRTTEQCHYITDTVGEDLLVQSTCNPALEGFTAPKVIWVRDNEPEILEKTVTMLLPKDYVRFRLTGEITAEVSDAAGTLLFDVRQRRWSEEVLDKLGIDIALLPPVCESVDICGKITAEVAKLTGLPVGLRSLEVERTTPVAQLATGLSVRGGFRQVSGHRSNRCTYDKAKVDPNLQAHSFCHSAPHKWYLMGVVLSAGGAFRWFRDNLGDSEVAAAKVESVDPYEVLTQRAAEAPVGSEGLIFLPYLTGERTPHADAKRQSDLFRHDVAARQAPSDSISDGRHCLRTTRLARDYP